MSDIGDALRRAAQEADENPKFTSYAAVATKGSSFRVFTTGLEDEDESREQAIRLLVNMAGAENVQAEHAAHWRD